MTETLEEATTIRQITVPESSLYHVFDSILNLEGQPPQDDQLEWLIAEKDRLQQRLTENNGHPQTSEICLYQVMGLNQRSDGPCSGCKRDWFNQFCPDYNPYILIKGVHS